MSIRYYDEALTKKIERWVVTGDRENSLRVLKPDETRRFFELTTEKAQDEHLSLPLICIARNRDFELNRNLKTEYSFDGVQISKTNKRTELINSIPIRLEYQIDIYTKTMETGEQLLNELIFKIVNNPSIEFELNIGPNSDTNKDRIITLGAKIRLLSQISDTSDISERLFNGQFTRWTLHIELLDCRLYNIKYVENAILFGASVRVGDDIIQKSPCELQQEQGEVYTGANTEINTKTIEGNIKIPVQNTNNSISNSISLTANKIK